MSRGGCPHIDRHQGVPDDVVQLMGVAQALLIEAMPRQRRALAFLLLGQNPHELLAGPDGIPRRQRSQHQRHVGHRLERDIAARGGDQHPSGHGRRHQGPDDQRANPVTVQADSENHQHHHGGSGMVGMEGGQARQQQRYDGDEHAERVAAPQRERQGGHQGETRRERRQLLHLMGSNRIEEQRGEGGKRQHHIKVRSAQQLSQRGPHRGDPDLHRGFSRSSVT